MPATKFGPVRANREPSIWVVPPKAARVIARDALRRLADLPPSRRGGLTKAEARKLGITSGVARAESIAKGERQPAEDVRDFFNRFRGTYLRALEDDKSWERSKVQQAWDLWGGIPMWRAAVEALGADLPDPF
jgi:hypothetical protein